MKLRKFSIEKKDKNENRTAIEVSGLEMPDWIAALLISGSFLTLTLLSVLYLH